MGYDCYFKAVPKKEGNVDFVIQDDVSCELLPSRYAATHVHSSDSFFFHVVITDYYKQHYGIDNIPSCSYFRLTPSIVETLQTLIADCDDESGVLIKGEVYKCCSYDRNFINNDLELLMQDYDVYYTFD